MVQKDNFRAENFCKKLIIALLIIFTVPLPVNSESQISSRKDCSLLKKKNDYLDVKDISKNIGFSEQHTRRILRHLFSEEIIIRQDQKNGNGRPNHLYSHKKNN